MIENKRLAHNVRKPRTGCVDAPHVLCGWCTPITNEPYSHTYRPYENLILYRLHRLSLLMPNNHCRITSPFRLEPSFKFFLRHLIFQIVYDVVPIEIIHKDRV